MSTSKGDASAREALLEQVGWIRRLARELVSDRHLAEDLAQETCAVALQKRPSAPGQLRSWLSGVLRQALRGHARSRARRGARERAAAQAETLESTARLVERLALQRELVRVVHELEEPYRSTVLLRFFEELPPREIARRSGVPVATVHSRLQRALAKLRERLDREQRAWGALLLPWVRGLPPSGPSVLLGVLMKVQVGLASVVVLSGALLWWSFGSAPEPGNGPAVLASSEEPVERANPALAPSASPHGAGEREPVAPAPARPAPALAAVEPKAWQIRARVLDCEARPAAGVAIGVADSSEALGVSGAGGWCVFETRAEELVLEALEPRWVTVRAGSVQRATSFDPILVVAPAIELTGSVRCAAGSPLSDAAVRLELPPGFDTRFTEVLDATRTIEWEGRTDREGRFRFARLPAVEGALVRASAPGYVSGSVALPLGARADVELVLARPALPLTGVLRGRVLDPAGRDVPGAHVGLGLTSALTDEEGAFELELRRAVTATTLVVVKAGYLPVRLERPEEPDGDSTGWPESVLVRLGEAALAIRGIVLDHAGEPVSKARLWLSDAGAAAPVGRYPLQLEALMAGAPVPAAASESVSALPAQDGEDFWRSMALADGEPTAFWNWVETDAHGAFELGGLEPRSYRFEVWRPDALELVTSDAIRAGTANARIRLPLPELFETVRGRVVSETGDGLPGVRVQVSRPIFDVRARVFGGESRISRVRHGASVLTDSEGRFSLTDIPVHGAELAAHSDEIIPKAVKVAAAEVEISVELRCHLEIALRAPLGRFDAVAVSDAEGERLTLMVLTDGNMYSWTDVPLLDGRSGVVSVSSRARHLLLLRAGVPVETLPLDLVPGSINRYEP